MGKLEKTIILILFVVPFFVIAMHCSSSDTPEKLKQESAKNRVEDSDTDRNTQPERISNMPEILRIALSPSIQGGEVVEDNKVLEQILSDKLGIPVECSVMTNYVAALTGLSSGRIDCTMVNPLGYVIAREKMPIEPILRIKRNDSTEYYAQIIVNNDSGINTIQELKGHKFAFVDVNSTSGYMYPGNFLKSHGIDADSDFTGKPAFVGSHDKVAIDVMNGVFDAGATFQDVRERVSEKYPEIMQKTKVIAVCGPIPNDLFCVSPAIDHDFKLKLIAALKEISLGVEIDGKIVKPFYDMDKIDELVETRDSDYQPVRDVMESLDIEIQPEVE